MRNRQHYFSIGQINISLRSECRSFVDEFASLYGPYRCGADSSESIRVEVRARHRYPWRRGPYTIANEDVHGFEVQHRHEVLPHLEWFINWQVIRQRQEYLQLHAATLEIGGQALVLPGNPGCGKSTLTAGLLARGWSYLCDEFALIDPKTLELQLFPRALCIKEPSFGAVDRLGLPLCRKTSYQKAAKGRVAFLNPLDVRPDVRGRPSRVRWVVFPQYVDGATPSLARLTKSKAAYDLARQCFNFRAQQERALAVLAGVVRDAECYQLTAGEVESTCNLIESRLLRQSSRKVG